MSAHGTVIDYYSSSEDESTTTTTTTTMAVLDEVSQSSMDVSTYYSAPSTSGDDDEEEHQQQEAAAPADPDDGDDDGDQEQEDPPDHDDSDDDDDDSDLPIHAMGTTGHRVCPFRGTPESWTVYEAYAMTIPGDLLLPRTNLVQEANGRAPFNWGDFNVQKPGAMGAKRLLYLLIAALTAAVTCDTGKPEHTLPPGASAAEKKQILKAVEKYKKTNAAGRVTSRPRGVAGATVSNHRELSTMKDMMLSPSVSSAASGGGTVWAVSSHTPGVFLLRTQSMDNHQVLARRATIALEELLSDRAETVGWRWWLLVHDPRISLPSWIVKEMAINMANSRKRTDRVQALRGSGRPVSKGLEAPSDDINSADCYRSIVDIPEYAKCVADYWAALERGGSGPAGVECPRRDIAASVKGIAVGSTSLHPAKVFAPHVAMAVKWSVDNVCVAQRTLNLYVNRRVNLIGGDFPRPHRVTMYNVAEMGPEPLHAMDVPQAKIDRTKIINRMALRQLKEWCHHGVVVHMSQLMHDEPIPPDLIEAVERNELAKVADIMSRPDAKTVAVRLKDAVTERDIEAREGALYERQSAPAARSSAFDMDADQSSDLEDDIRMGYDDDDDDDDGLLQSCNSGAFETNLSLSAMFENLMSAEEDGSCLTMEDVLRYPLMQMRMVNHNSLSTIEKLYEPGTTEYRVAMENFRAGAMEKFISYIMAHVYNDDSDEAMSPPLRKGLQFLLDLNRKPNYTRRHAMAIRRQRGANARRAISNRRESLQLFMSALNRAGDDSSRAPPMRSAPASYGSDRRAGGGVDAPTQGLWYCWNGGGAMNLTDYGNWRVTFESKAKHFFRCKPGETTISLIVRLLFMQMTAAWYRWNMHGDNLLWGPGGVGKSYAIQCLKRQSFDGQMEFWDNITPKAFTAKDIFDLMVLIEEAPCRFVGQDEKGVPVPGDELLKTMLTRHCLTTEELKFDPKTKKRHMEKVRAIIMMGVVIATNLMIKNMPNGEEPPINRRYMKSHVSCADSSDVSLAKINNPLSVENNTPAQIEYFNQMKITNVLCMLVEKLIQAKVLMDVNLDVCALHFSWFFDAVHRRCKVPKATNSNQDHLFAACRQVAIRYAVHRVYFSDHAAKDIRCKPKHPGLSDSTNPEDWVPKPFEFQTLLRVQPYLVVTEEMVIDVLTTMRSTYIPTTSWRVLKCLKEIVRDRKPGDRLVTQSTLWMQQGVGRQGDDEDDPNDGLLDTSTDDSDMEGLDDYDGDDDDMISMIVDDGRSHTLEKERDGRRVCSDKNYYAFQFPNRFTAWDYFSSQSQSTLDCSLFQEVMSHQLNHQLITHKDLNRPKREYDAEAGQHRTVRDPVTNERIYDTIIQSPVVVVESAPVEQDGGEHDAMSMVGKRHVRRATNTAPPVQICILKEFLDQDRKDSLNDIIKEGFGYRGAKLRQVVTACGTEERIFVRETGNGDQGKTAVTMNYMGTVVIEPQHDRRLVRINHFPDTPVTDTFVFQDEDFGEGEAMSQRAKLRRQIHMNVDGFLDKIVIDDYWQRCGLPEDQSQYPWIYTQRVRDMVMSGKDPIGVPTNPNYRHRYPDDFRVRRRRNVVDDDADDDEGDDDGGGDNGITNKLREYMRQSNKRQRCDI